MRSIASIEAPTIAGASVLENKYGLDFWRKISIISFFPDVKPPDPPPRALPKVPCEHMVLFLMILA